MADMKRSVVLISVVAGVALAGCGSGARKTVHYTTSPPTTISGVGVQANGPPPKPSSPTACTGRWNGAENASGRAAVKQHAPKADAALVGRAAATGYFREYAGRCLIYLITPPKSAAVFVETAPGRFVFTADATGPVTANADLDQSGSLSLH